MCLVSLFCSDLANFIKKRSQTLRNDSRLRPCFPFNEKLSHLSIFLSSCLTLGFIPIRTEHCECFSTASLAIRKNSCVVAMSHLLNILSNKFKYFSLLGIFFENIVIRRSCERIFVDNVNGLVLVIFLLFRLLSVWLSPALLLEKAKVWSSHWLWPFAFLLSSLPNSF